MTTITTTKKMLKEILDDIERLSKEGFKFYDEQLNKEIVLYGKDAKKALGYYQYKREYEREINIQNV